MNKHIQIREVPEELHRALKARAASEGLSMSDYLKRLIERELRRPDWASVAARRARLKAVDLGQEAVRIIREERESR